VWNVSYLEGKTRYRYKVSVDSIGQKNQIWSRFGTRFDMPEVKDLEKRCEMCRLLESCQDTV
jgi:hypothetical protein